MTVDDVLLLLVPFLALFLLTVRVEVFKILITEASENGL